MTISGYSNAIVDLMLGWLKGLANWVLRLFNLAGNVGGSPLLWLSRNWLKLLIFFLVVGVVLDRLIWLIRWRPYWVWFRKERVIVNDDRFFANADMDKASDWEGDLVNNWDEHDYVVASTVVRRRYPARSGRSAQKSGKRTSDAREDRAPRRRAEGTKVRRVDQGRSASAKRRHNAEETQERKAEEARRAREKSRAKTENIFAGELKKRDVTDSYEDEVFNLSNLPAVDEPAERVKKPRRAKRRRR